MSRTTNDDGRILECPVCGAEMLVETVNGVRVDVCDEHGMWLDAGELERIRRTDDKRSRPRKKREFKRKKGRLERWFDALEDFFD